jgi:hypothetical protein
MLKEKRKKKKTDASMALTPAGRVPLLPSAVGSSLNAAAWCWVLSLVGANPLCVVLGRLVGAAGGAGGRGAPLRGEHPRGRFKPWLKLKRELKKQGTELNTVELPGARDAYGLKWFTSEPS